MILEFHLCLDSWSLELKKACSTLGAFYSKNTFIMMLWVDIDNKEYKKLGSWK